MSSDSEPISDLFSDFSHTILVISSLDDGPLSNRYILPIFCSGVPWCVFRDSEKTHCHELE